MPKFMNCRTAILPAAACLLAAACQGAKIASDSNPPVPLTRAGDVHGLTIEVAGRALPVLLRGIVTYYDPFIDTRHVAIFVHDDSGDIFVAPSAPPEGSVFPGSLVDVSGVTGTGDFAPLVERATVRVIGQSRIPASALPVSLTELLTGEYDGHWVEVRGVVRDVREFGKNTILELAMGDGSISATTMTEPGVDYARLVDAKIRMHANAAPVYNGNRQMIGARLLFPNMAEVKIEEPAVADPFALPVLPVIRLLNYDPNVAFRHRVHVLGRVTLQWPGRSLCIDDANRGLCVQTTQTTAVAEGDLVDVAGFSAIGGFSPTLNNASFRRAGAGAPVSPPLLTAERVMKGNHDARLIRIEGKVIGIDRAAKDPTMVLEAGKYLFPVVLGYTPPGDSTRRAAAIGWEEGSTLQVTGICAIQISPPQTLRDGLWTPDSFRILLRGPADVVVVRKPSWWTPAHLLPVMAGVLAVTLLVLVWAVVLRRRLAEQTALIREQNATLHDLSFRDGLTGIANRRQFDETLQMEFRRSLRTQDPVALLILDIDHFKLLNDQEGHLRGDECLIQVAKTLSSAGLRKSDLVARYGGEEFAVILPGVNEAGALAAAERMRNMIFDLGIAHPGPNQRLSVSIGAASIVPTPGMAQAKLVALADGALYQSKLQGRNRTTVAPRDGTEADGEVLELAQPAAGTETPGRS